MTISMKGFAVASGIYSAGTVFWCILMDMLGIGSVPFQFMDQLYFGLLSPSFFGLIYGTLWAGINGLIFGAVFVFYYNFFSED